MVCISSCPICGRQTLDGAHCKYCQQACTDNFGKNLSIGEIKTASQTLAFLESERESRVIREQMESTMGSMRWRETAKELKDLQKKFDKLLKDIIPCQVCGICKHEKKNRHMPPCTLCWTPGRVQWEWRGND